MKCELSAGSLCACSALLNGLDRRIVVRRKTVGIYGVATDSYIFHVTRGGGYPHAANQPSKRCCAKPATSRHVDIFPKGLDSTGRSRAHVNTRSKSLSALSSEVNDLRPQ